MATILVADDDPHIRDVVQYALERDGHRTVLARDGKEALAVATGSELDALVLDIVMPELDGLEVCRRLRATSMVPVLFLSSRGEETDRVVGLELGGDDYVVKPFSPRELSARVKALLRRSKSPVNPGVYEVPAVAEKVVVHAGVTLNVTRHEVVVGEERLDLSVTEFSVLLALFERPNHVLSREQLMQRIYPDQHHVSDRTIDTHVKRVRAKLRAAGVDPVETVHGLGYRAGGG